MRKFYRLPGHIVGHDQCRFTPEIIRCQSIGYSILWQGANQRGIRIFSILHLAACCSQSHSFRIFCPTFRSRDLVCVFMGLDIPDVRYGVVTPKDSGPASAHWIPLLVLVSIGYDSTLDIIFSRQEALVGSSASTNCFNQQIHQMTVKRKIADKDRNTCRRATVAPTQNQLPLAVGVRIRYIRATSI